jgi:hypothetical protein
MDTTGKHITAPGWDDVLAACLKTTSPVENGDTCEAREVSAWRKKVRELRLSFSKEHF